ncbi:MAG TPA: TetR/AcrR family transcriptional regulator [Pseudonocardiaceae bacterium]|jgi:TetR/AcrR family transcriptional repressor of nem operon|nr:TetR/AcrR family transcriptional regulator [Pseudonocardiaceae bacterium]
MGRNRSFDVDEALGSALRAFWEHGYDKTSMQDICQAMNIQPGSVYATFGSKRDLFVAALRRYAETVSAEAVARVTDASSGLRGIRDYFTHLVDAMVDGDRRWGCLITNSLVEFATRDPELVDLMSQHLANLRAAFAAALARAAAADELRPGVDASSADLLVAVVQGMNVLAKSQPGRSALAAVAESAIAGLRPDRSVTTLTAR